MTEPHSPIPPTDDAATIRSPEPTGTAPAPSGPKWIRTALAVSVALNLAVAGLAVGAFLKGGPGRGMPHDLSFGPFSDALDGDDRRALRMALMDRMPSFRESRAEARAEFATLLDALRASPFDGAALQSALAAIETRNADRLELGRSLIEARILQMTEDERLAFAERLEKGLRRRE
ncbi:MAG: periplasmic heavy metal sensor [Rhodobacterales bacterium]|nr:periplasmic heavy metal sensor [Rhodobacterales bacterium]